VAQALILLRREGLEGVTFRKLISRLKVKAPAIYWRFRDKQDLLEAMAESILQEFFADWTPMQPGESSWQVWLAHTMNRLRQAMLGYPDGGRVIAGARPHQTPTLARIAECSLRALEDSGVPLATAAGIVFTAVHYTFGHVIEEQSSPSLDVLAGPAAASVVSEFPTIARLIQSSRDRGHTPQAIYELGISLIIRGGEFVAADHMPPLKTGISQLPE